MFGSEFPYVDHLPARAEQASGAQGERDYNQNQRSDQYAGLREAVLLPSHSAVYTGRIGGAAEHTVFDSNTTL